LEFVARGQTTKQIASALHVSSSTVTFHLKNASRKLGASSRSEAVALAMKQGRIDLC